MANVPSGATTRATEASADVRSRGRTSDCRMPYGAMTRGKERSANGSDRMSPRIHCGMRTSTPRRKVRAVGAPVADCGLIGGCGLMAHRGLITDRRLMTACESRVADCELERYRRRILLRAP